MKKTEIQYTIHYANTDGIDIYVKNTRNVVFRCSLGGMPYCCGMVELGDIQIWTDYITKDFESLLDKAVKELVESRFPDDDDDEGFDGEIMIIANLIENTACEYLKESFIRTKCFEQVATFTNRNSGNDITVWLSKKQ